MQGRHVLWARVSASPHFLRAYFIKLIILFNLGLFENQPVLKHLSFHCYAFSVTSPVQIH